VGGGGYFAYTRLSGGRAALAAQPDLERVRRMRQLHTGSITKYAFFSLPKDPTGYRAFIRTVKALEITAWNFLPNVYGDKYLWEDEDFRAVKAFCEVADEEGLKVWATLVLPSESDAVRAMRGAKAREYYLNTVRRFAEIAARHPSLVGYTCGEFCDNLDLFTPDFCREMTGAARVIAPGLAFMPFCFWQGLDERFFSDYGPFIDGIIFQFRCDSQPRNYIPDYDPANFDHYAQCMRHELKRVRQFAGEWAVICEICVWYTHDGWGVQYKADGTIQPEGKQPAAHAIKDASLKLEVARELSHGVCIYGITQFEDPVHMAMGKLLKQWRDEGKKWGGGE
jgi:hypothetical protein